MNFTFDPYRQRWEDAYNRGDMAAVLELYTDDAVFFNFDGTRIEGRKAIETYLKEQLQQLTEQVHGKRIRFESKLTEEEIHDDVGFLFGTYQYLLPERTVVMEGTFGVVGKKHGTDWRIFRHMSTGLMAVPAEPGKEPAAV